MEYENLELKKVLIGFFLFIVLIGIFLIATGKLSTTPRYNHGKDHCVESKLVGVCINDCSNYPNDWQKNHCDFFKGDACMKCMHWVSCKYARDDGLMVDCEERWWS